MTIPSYRDVDLAVLLELTRARAAMRPTDVVERVVRHFPDMTQEDLAQTRTNSKAKVFRNMVAWGKDHLRVRGLLSEASYGQWKVDQGAESALIEDLVERGVGEPRAKSFVTSAEALPDLLGRSWARPVVCRQYVRKSRALPRQDQLDDGNGSPRRHDDQSRQLTGESDGKRETAKEQLLERLNALEPYEFEQLIARVLDSLGFRDTQVVGRPGDEGVDLIAWLWSPLVTAKVAVQVKRHVANVGPKDVSYLRDRWAHRADRLMLITTSNFTPGAREVAEENPGRAVQLVTGEELVEIMIENELGVRSRPRLFYSVDEEYFSG